MHNQLQNSLYSSVQPPLLLYRPKTDTEPHFPPRYKTFSASGMCWEQRGWHSPKSAPSIPEKLMGYLCNKPVHPSQVYATLHSLYLPWSAGLCKLGKTSTEWLLSLLHRKRSLQRIPRRNEEAGKSRKEENQELCARRKSSQSSTTRRSWGRQKMPGHR